MTSEARQTANARQHELTAAHVAIAAEGREEFEELHAQLQSDVRPQGARCPPELLRTGLSPVPCAIGLDGHGKWRAGASRENPAQLPPCERCSRETMKRA